MPHFVDDSYFPPNRPDAPDFFDPPVDKINPVVLFFPNNGYINDPQLSVENIQQASELNGATFMLNAEVAEIRKHANRVTGITLKSGQKSIRQSSSMPQGRIPLLSTDLPASIKKRR